VPAIEVPEILPLADIIPDQLFFNFCVIRSDTRLHALFPGFAMSNGPL
jgi:hypothetical protein